MPFNYDLAKKDGFTDEDIAKHLSKQSGFNYDAATKDGFKPKDIINKLSDTKVGFNQPKPSAPSMAEMGMQEGLTPGSSQPVQPDPNKGAILTEGPQPEPHMFPPGSEQIPAMLGATALTLAAPEVGIPAAAGLAALGGAGGEGVRQVVSRLTPGEDPSLPATSGEAAKSLGVAGAKQAAYELVGRSVIKGIRYLAAPFKNSISEGAPAVNEKLKKYGSSLSSSQMTDSKTLDALENVARGGFMSSGLMAAKDAEQNKALGEMSKDVSRMFAQDIGTKLGRDEIGEVFANTVQGGREAHKTVSEKLYHNVDELVDESVTGEGQLQSAQTGQFKAAIVPTTLLKNEANNVAAEYSRISDIGKSDVGTSLIEKIRALPDRIGFGDAQFLRSNLLSLSRDLGTTGEARARAFVSKMIDHVGSAMEDAAGELPKNAFEAWQKANKFYKFGARNFDNNFISKLALSGDVPWEQVGDKIFAPGNVEQVNLARRALRAAEFTQKTEKAMGAVRYPKDLKALAPNQVSEIVNQAGKSTDLTPEFSFKDAWRRMQSGFYENQILGPSTDVEGKINGKILSQKINNPKMRDTMGAAFTSEQNAAIKDFADTVRFVQKKTQGPGKMAIQLAQGGAILNLVSAPFVAAMGGDVAPIVGKAMGSGGGALFIAPDVFAHLLTSPKTAKWLTEGIQLPAGTEAGTVLGARVLSAANSIHNEAYQREFLKRKGENRGRN